MRFLLLRFSSIGDIVLCSSVIRSINNTYPSAEIHFFTKQDYAEILEFNPYLSQLHLLQADNQIPIALRNLKFDYVIDLHKNLRTTVFRSKLHFSQWITYKKLNVEKWLLVNLKINLLEKRHLVDRYFDALKPLGVKYDGLGHDFFINPNHSYKADFPAELFDKPFVAIVLGAKFKTKQIPTNHLQQLVNSIQENIVLIGGQDELETANLLAIASVHPCFNYCGKLSLQQSAYLIGLADKVLAHDTGFMHIACAFNKPMISVWGNTVPELGFYPLYKENGAADSQIAEVHNLSCRPCSKLGKKKCPKGHFNCMNKQDYQAITNWLNS